MRRLAKRAPSPLDVLFEAAAGAVADAAGVVESLRGVGIEGWDPEHIRRTLPLLRGLVAAYFRPDVRGLENIPREGAALLVGNHSGGLLIADTFVFSCAFYDHFGPDRRFHQLAHDVAVRVPYLGGLRRYGTVPASHANAEAAFAAGAPVLVYPGGDYETFRPSSHSDQIEFGGRKGFIRLALEEKVPIVPVVSIGGQETALFVSRGRRLAKLTRFDKLTRIKVLPITIGPPFGVNILDLPGRVPLPAKITIQVLPAIDLKKEFGDDPDVDEVYERVTEQMQQTLSALQDERNLPIVG
ncbi:MAG: 1-acyl-sn-glycerol-3-phosphate acyltransferase [Actinomycetota bacterium]|nr:1-acyl-sn-glycerol-3-phosphate acyltransferase [Actinomycetota bacterium]